MASFNATNVNYRDNYFQHTDLTPIRGEPTNETLKTLVNEIKENAQTVHSTLVGGANGHLGLVLTTARYNQIAPGQPYVRPIFPGTLTIPPGQTNAQALITRDQHNEAIRLFQETEAIHNALVQQLVKVVDPMYLQALRNPITNKFNVPIHEIIQHLATTYGKSTAKQHQAKEHEIISMTYNTNLPVDVVFTPIDDFVDLSDLVGVPKSEQQKIQYAYLIFQKCGKFKSDLKTWNRNDRSVYNSITHIFISSSTTREHSSKSTFGHTHFSWATM